MLFCRGRCGRWCRLDREGGTVAVGFGPIELSEGVAHSRCEAEGPVQVVAQHIYHK